MIAHQPLKRCTTEEMYRNISLTPCFRLISRIICMLNTSRTSTWLINSKNIRQCGLRNISFKQETCRYLYRTGYRYILLTLLAQVRLINWVNHIDCVNTVNKINTSNWANWACQVKEIKRSTWGPMIYIPGVHWLKRHNIKNRCRSLTVICTTKKYSCHVLHMETMSAANLLLDKDCKWCPISSNCEALATESCTTMY